MPWWHFHRRLALPTVSRFAAVALSSLTQAAVCSLCCLFFTFTHAALLGCCRLGISWHFWVWWSSLPLLDFDAPSPGAVAHKISISVCNVRGVADSFFSHQTVYTELAGCVLPEVSCSCRVAVLRCPELISLCLRQVTRLGLCSPVGTHRGTDQCNCWLWRLRRHGFLMALHDEPDPVCSAGAAASAVVLS